MFQIKFQQVSRVVNKILVIIHIGISINYILYLLILNIYLKSIDDRSAVAQSTS